MDQPVNDNQQEPQTPQPDPAAPQQPDPAAPQPEPTPSPSIGDVGGTPPTSQPEPPSEAPTV